MTVAALQLAGSGRLVKQGVGSNHWTCPTPEPGDLTGNDDADAGNKAHPESSRSYMKCDLRKMLKIFDIMCNILSRSDPRPSLRSYPEYISFISGSKLNQVKNAKMLT